MYYNEMSKEPPDNLTEMFYLLNYCKGIENTEGTVNNECRVMNFDISN